MNRPDQLPAGIGRFRVDALLGRGGMGAVYKAFDPTLQRVLAVKTVRPDIDRPEYLERLYREAQACARLHHPNIVTVYEAGEFDGQVYIAMEYLEGESLADALPRGRLTFEERIRILVQILEALEHAHALGVIHRDIKPSNIHRLANGSVKLVDFGLARVVQADTLTASGAIMGTPHYASPEQLKGEPIDARTDVYSTGALAYEMLAGRRPFAGGPDDTMSSVMLRVISQPPPPMNTVWSRALPEVEQVVFRAMAKSPDERFASAEEMRSVLVALVSSRRDTITAVQAEDDRTIALSRGDDTTGRQTTHTAPPPPTTHTVPPIAPTYAASTPPTSRSQTRTATVPSLSVEPSIGSVTTPQRAGRMWWWAGALAVGLIAGVVVWQWPRASMPDAALQNAARAAVSERSAALPPGGAGGASTDTAAALSSPAVGAAVPHSVRPGVGTPLSVSDPSARSGSASDSTSRPEPASTFAATPLREATAKQMFTGEPGATSGPASAGLKYRLIQRPADGTDTDVDTSATFHSGDRVRFVFESNIDGFLYVVLQGSSGRWTVLFPHPQMNGGRNAIAKGEQYTVPPDDWFLFDATPGTEKVFVFLSREAITQLPGFDRPVTRAETIRASVVDDLQQSVRPRDLIFEKDRSTPGQGGSALQATYVVNRAEAGKAVAISISLAHGQ